MTKLSSLRVLNANTMKFLAAFFMVIDHVGLMFFPDYIIFRIIGRLSMPLFAFAISEGCRYTKNKTKHFLLIFILATLCQTVYYFFGNDLYMSILVTFSLSILTIYSMQYAKRCIFGEKVKISKKIFSVALFICVVVAVYLLNKALTIDYGFWGCMTPVFASIFDFHHIPAPDKLKKLDNLPLRVCCMMVAIFFVAIAHRSLGFPYYALCAFPLLLAYNGQKGKLNTKYFFYIFYPLHLVVLEGILLFLI